MKAIQPGAERPLEQVPHVAAGKRLLDAGLGPLADQGRPQRKSNVHGVEIEAGEVKHRVDQDRVEVGCGTGGLAGDLPGRIRPPANDRSERPRGEIRLTIPSKSASAKFQYRAWPVSRPASVRYRAIQNVAWLETSSESLPAPLADEPVGS